MTKKITNSFTLVISNDYQGLYCNGVLVDQDHKISASEALCRVIEYGGISIFRRVDCDTDWLDDLGEFPEKLEDVKLIE